MEAALKAIKKRNPKKVVVAAPVAPIQTSRRFRDMADEVVVWAEPSIFYAIGSFYQDFSEVTDEEVASILKEIVKA